MRTAIIDALEARYEAQILEADATLKIYLENSVGIGEHPQHIDEVDKLIEKNCKCRRKNKSVATIQTIRREDGRFNNNR